MKPLVYSKDSRARIEDYKVDWKNLLVSATTLDRENGISYLEKIKKYCNNGGMPNGIVAKKFELKNDPEFSDLLAQVHGFPFIQRKLVKTLFTETGILSHLKEFETDKHILRLRLTRAGFKFLNSFKIEGELSYYLYRYGMYNHFHQDHSHAEAVKITRELLKFVYGDDPANVVCFETHQSWGNWFDPYSCSDLSVFFINISTKTAWLFCFSHSD